VQEAAIRVQEEFVYGVALLRDVNGSDLLLGFEEARLAAQKQIISNFLKNKINSDFLYLSFCKQKIEFIKCF